MGRGVFFAFVVGCGGEGRNEEVRRWGGEGTYEGRWGESVAVVMATRDEEG